MKLHGSAALSLRLRQRLGGLAQGSVGVAAAAVAAGYSR